MSETGANADKTGPGWRQRLREGVESARVQNAIVALIVLNAVTLGLETSEHVMRHVGPILLAIDQAILAVFVVEIVVKLVGWDWRFFRSAWNVFDFVIVAIALLPATGPFSILRALRVLRVLRLIGRVPRLRRLVESLLRALPSIGWVVFLLGMVFYIFGVMGTELFGDDHREHFGTLGRTLYTLFQVMTLESWSESIARPIMADHPWAALYFVVFIVITALTVLNLFIGVIVSTMQEGVQADESRQREQAEAQAHHERAEMLHLIRRLDARLAHLEGDRPDTSEATPDERR